ncbi:hypothetical protein KVR01_006022 [Diaporthe batatas]|uniref:uncharacterized protein n=1 Tax=Diaporthe batatas TaxID=748121 RepID=UPI001D043085|nr:uncharacterized protein KVR01_006022 [Diaporthe batatas]KAG8164104.1 hypothetical protein KVR01_006022 [Diaporthe batatas]
MAIIEDLGLEVKIVVNDSPLQEYEDKEQEPTNDGFGDEIRKYRSYVEVMDNAEFAVLLRATSNNEYLSATKAGFMFAIDLDGQNRIENLWLHSEHLTSLVKGKYENDGQETTLRRFRFTAVSPVPCDALIREIGFRYVDPVKVPLAIFYFKYRSRAILQQELVIPGEPSPVDVDIDSLSLREIRRLAKEGNSASSEVANKRDSSRGAVKREPGEDQIAPRPRKIVKMSNGREAVDLTEDD